MSATGPEDHRDGRRRVVDLDEISVTVGFDGRSVAWRGVADLADAGPDDAVFAVDPETGRIVFGDGEHGRVPPDDALVQVRYREGSDGGGNLIGQGALIDGYDYGFQLTPSVSTPPGKIRQIVAADGWYAVELRASGERLIPLLGWALLDPYFPPYRSGNELPLVTTQSVRGLIAPDGRSVRIVDELTAWFGGYRRA